MVSFEAQKLVTGQAEGHADFRPEQVIPIARPDVGDAEIEALVAVARSGELVQGRWVSEFEDAFAEFCGARYAVATSSGTTALHVALLAHGIGPGHEVITTAFTFIASTNAILYVGARPVFADIEPETFTIDPDGIESLITPRTRAILAVDLYGHPADLPRLQAIAERHGLILIDDASQAHGAAIDGRQVGSFGTATFTFYPSKNMTTAEGGMITTDSEEVASLARRLRNHGSETRYFHEQLGFNFRMTNLQAALGIEQLKRLPTFNRQRIANAEFLTSQLQGIPTPITRPGTRHVFHQYTLRVQSGRDKLMAALADSGIDSRVYYPWPVHQQPSFLALGYQPVSLPETERAAAEVLSVPVYPSLTREELAYIAHSVCTAWP